MATEERVQALLTGRMGMLVRLTSVPGGRLALLDALHRYTDSLEGEPGTEMFIVHIDPDDEDVAWLYEVFRDADAQQQHRAAEGFARLMEELPGVLAAPPGVLRLDPLRISLQDTVLTEEWAL